MNYFLNQPKNRRHKWKNGREVCEELLQQHSDDIIKKDGMSKIFLSRY